MLNLLENSLYKNAVDIVRALQRNGHQAYFVGGAVRDALMGKAIKDIDIVTSALPAQVQMLFPRTFDVGAAFGIVVAVVDDANYEIATLREEREYSDGRHPEQITYTDNPKLDAARRDFTINAMFYDPINHELLDYYDGQGDLSLGILRTVGEASVRFKEDFLRMLRAVRFCCRFRFEMHKDIISAVKKLKSNVNKLSCERVRDEINNMLTGTNPAGSIETLLELGLLEEVLPEVAAMSGVEQWEEYHPEGDVFEHTMLMLKHISWPSSELAWSILLHDIGKPKTLTQGEDGIPHFYGHEDVGARMAEGILSRLKFSNRESEAIVHAVRQHMRFAHVDQMRKSTWLRMMAAAKFPMELELHRIDCISSNKLMGNYTLMLDRLPELEAQRNLPPKLVTGKDLIAMGMKPGPKFGRIIKSIRDMQLEGQISSVDEALEKVREMILKMVSD